MRKSIKLMGPENSLIRGVLSGLLLIGISLLLSWLLCGCATSKVATYIGSHEGTIFKESAESGIKAAENIKAWPYVSGQIKGIYSKDYEEDLPLSIRFIIQELDALAAKESLTDEEKGMVIGYWVRLEALAVEFGWNRYGVSIYQLIMQYAGAM